MGRTGTDGIKVINSNHIVVWGALQSIGEMVGMVSLTPVSDHYGRKTTMIVIWFILVGVSDATLFYLPTATYIS